MRVIATLLAGRTTWQRVSLCTVAVAALSLLGAPVARAAHANTPPTAASLGAANETVFTTSRTVHMLEQQLSQIQQRITAHAGIMALEPATLHPAPDTRDARLQAQLQRKLEAAQTAEAAAAAAFNALQEEADTARQSAWANSARAAQKRARNAAIQVTTGLVGNNSSDGPALSNRSAAPRGSAAQQWNGTDATLATPASLEATAPSAVLPVPNFAVSAAVTAPSAAATTAVQTALNMLGTPYVWGGASPTTGFDCSGLVQYAYGRAGLTLPRTTWQQWTVGSHVTPDKLQPGDIVFFESLGHEALYIGNGFVVQAPHTGDIVRVTPLAELAAQAGYVGAVDPSASNI